MSDILRDFNLWWRANSFERREMGIDALSLTDAIERYCELTGYSPESIVHEYEKVYKFQ